VDGSFSCSSCTEGKSSTPDGEADVAVSLCSPSFCCILIPFSDLDFVFDLDLDSDRRLVEDDEDDSLLEGDLGLFILS
jgi:hypothetical protein